MNATTLLTWPARPDNLYYPWWRMLWNLLLAPFVFLAFWLFLGFFCLIRGYAEAVELAERIDNPFSTGGEGCGGDE